MWQPLFVTLVVAVYTVLGSPCTVLQTGIASPYVVQLTRANLKADKYYDVDAKTPCNGEFAVGVYIIACTIENHYFWPPSMMPTSEVSVAQVNTTRPATVDMLAFCHDPVEKQDPQAVEARLVDIKDPNLKAHWQ